MTMNETSQQHAFATEWEKSDFSQTIRPALHFAEEGCQILEGYFKGHPLKWAGDKFDFRPCEVTLTSDSKYVCDGISKGWAASWKKNGWKKKSGTPALNPDLWDRLLALCEIHSVTFVWVKGHAGHPYNERCDALAQAESGKYL